MTPLRNARRAALLREIVRRGGRIDLDRSTCARCVMEAAGIFSWRQFDRAVGELALADLVRVKPDAAGGVVASAVSDRPAGDAP